MRRVLIPCAMLAGAVALGAQTPPQPLTSVDDGVTSFEWSPDGTRIAFTATEAKPASLKDREKQYGEFQVIDQEHRMTHLFVIDVRSKATRPLTAGAFTVGSFQWSPD